MILKISFPRRSMKVLTAKKLKTSFLKGFFGFLIFLFGSFTENGKKKENFEFISVLHLLKVIQKKLKKIKRGLKKIQIDSLAGCSVGPLGPSRRTSDSE